MFQPGHSKGLGTTLCNYESKPVAGEQRNSVTTECSLVIHFVVVLVLLLAYSQAQADISDSFRNLSQESAVEQRYLYRSLHTKHYDPDPDHVNDQQMVGLEFGMAGNRLWGMAIFNNSFGQKSKYLYIGKKWHIFESDRLYFKLTGGLLHGYEDPYEDKIPFNGLGIAPAVVPAIGYSYKDIFVEFAQLGVAAGMINVGRRF
jgi:hypothetical protein